MGTFLNLVKKHVAVVTALALLLTTFMPAMANASEEDHLSELEDLLVAELADENIEVENVEITGEEVIIEVAVEDAEGGEVLTSLEFAPGSSYMSLFAEVYNAEGELEYTEFIIDLNYVGDHDGASDEPLELMFEHVESGEIIEYSSEYGVLSSQDDCDTITSRGACAICIGCLSIIGGIVGGVIGIVVGVGTAIVDTLLTAGMIIIEAGIALVSVVIAGAELVLASLMSLVPSGGLRVEIEISFHFEAFRRNGDVFIGAGLTDAEAAARLRNRQDIWSVSREYAQSAAAQASGTLLFGRRATPFGPSNGANTGRQSNLYYDHFQPNPRPISGGNAFFGYEPRPGRFR